MPDCPATRREGPLRLGDVLRLALPEHTARRRLPPHHWKALRALMACQTGRLGGHLYLCSACGREHFVPHSCRNRHCPGCQGANAANWLQQQAASLLPIPYFHLVFTVPHALNPLIAHNQASLYALLFGTVGDTLLAFGRRRFQAEIGITAVLHTWSQTLLDHYHLHCIVTGGGLRDDGSWSPANPRWLFPVRALSEVFRAKFRDGLLERERELNLAPGSVALRRLVKDATRTPWVVYAKRPFAGPEQVLAYLARYTHRVGLTNGRLRAVDETSKTVAFAYKDYADGSRHKEMVVGFDEFVRRFRLHLLPPRFVKIRHYGLLANRNRRRNVGIARAALPPMSVARTPDVGPFTPRSTPPPCPHCRHPGLVLIRILRLDPARGPPEPR